MFTIPPSVYRQLPNLLYTASINLPVTCTFVSLYEIFSTALSRKPHPQKTYAEMACTLIWGFGHLALRVLHIYRKVRGENLYQDYVKTRNVVSLEESAKLKHKEALYELGTKFRDGTSGFQASYPRAEVLFQEGLKLGHHDCALALGQLYLSGTIGEKATAFVEATRHFQMVQSPFTNYLAEFAVLLNGCKAENDRILNILQTSKGKFETTPWPVIIGFAIKTSQLPTIPPRNAQGFFECAIRHLSSPKDKAEAHFQLFELLQNRDHLKEAARLGHIEAILGLVDLLKSGSIEEQKEALRLLLTIPAEKRTPDISTKIGHFYLTGTGFESSEPTQAAVHYKNAQPNGFPTDSTRYFLSLCQLLTESTPEERSLFKRQAALINTEVKWMTTIPPITAPGTDDMALAVAESLLPLLVDETTGALLSRESETPSRTVLILKLYEFSATYALPPLAKRRARLQLGDLHVLLGNTTDAISVFTTCVEDNQEDSVPKMRLVNILMKQPKKPETKEMIILLLEDAVSQEHAPAKYVLGVLVYEESQNIKTTKQTGLFRTNAPEKENSQATRGKKLILDAARAFDQNALSYCQKQKWPTGLNIAVLNERRRRMSSTSQINIQTTASMLVPGHATPPPLYDNEEN